MVDSRTLAVVSAGLGQPSTTKLLADRLATAARDQLRARDIEVALVEVELRGQAHAIVDNLLTGFAPAGLAPLIEAVTGADGLVVVSPVFNASYSGLFKSFFDILPEGALADRPVLIAATGGTARHSLVLEHALRPMFTYLRAVVMPTGVFAAAEDWAGVDAPGILRQRIDRAAAELADQVARHGQRPSPDPFALRTSFEDLLP